MNYNRIKAVLAEKRRKSGELAEHLGVVRQTVSFWCRNVTQPELPTLFRIAEFLGVEARELLTERKDLMDINKKKPGRKKK
jgi:transcriptional regulator with XRE-family HTH domain